MQNHDLLNVSYKEMVDELQKLNIKHCGNKGIDCVVQIIVHLSFNEWEQACQVTNNEWDKIQAYPDIAELLLRYGLFKPLQIESLVEPKVNIYMGPDNTTMVEVIPGTHNKIMDFFRLFAAWGDNGKLVPSLSGYNTVFIIECCTEFYQLAKQPYFARAFDRLGFKAKFEKEVFNV